MRLLGVVAAIFGLGSSIPAGADSLESGPMIDPLALKCLLRERKFFTEILFSQNGSDELRGEMCHYVNVGHGRRFLSGSVFFNITANERQIQGYTGDPRGIVLPFVLEPVHPTAFNGVWRYLQTENSGQRTEVRFRCTYGEP